MGTNMTLKHDRFFLFVLTDGHTFFHQKPKRRTDVPDRLLDI